MSTFCLKTGLPDVSFDLQMYPGFVLVTVRDRKFVSKLTHEQLVILDGTKHYFYHLLDHVVKPVRNRELQTIRKTYYDFPPLFIKAQLVEHFIVIDMAKEELSVADVQYAAAKMFIDSIIQPMVAETCPNMSVKLLFNDEVKQKHALFHLAGVDLHLVLCLYRRKQCVSSITYSFYDDSLLIESRTSPRDENKRYNTLLRAITILLTDKLMVNSRPVHTIKSQPINWVSAWLLTSRFGFRGGSSAVSKTQKQAFRKEFDEDQDYELNVTAVSYQRAWKVLQDTLNNLVCE